MKRCSPCIDLRSDTITRPSQLMRDAMAGASVGDDVFGEDPTVNQLEREVAGILGKEAAVFVPSGTMANQIAIRAHTQPGDEILCDGSSHCISFESGAPAALSGVMIRPLPGVRGIFSMKDIENCMRPWKGESFAPQTLLVVENTHNNGGGSVWPIDAISGVTDFVRRQGMKTHLDGARLWNATAASGVPEYQYAAHFDSVAVCFSKGLGACVGSALAGTTEFVLHARRFRKMFGGSMRQAGIIAAGALFALRFNRERLGIDHENAKLLAYGIDRIPGLTVKVEEVESNIVYFDMSSGSMSAQELEVLLKEQGVAVLAVGPNRLRAVTCYEVTREGIESALSCLSDVLLHSAGGDV